MNKRNLALVLSMGVVVAFGNALVACLSGHHRVFRNRPVVAQPQRDLRDIIDATKHRGGNTDRPTNAGRTPEPSDPRWKEREMKRQIDPQYEWKMPINFYGRVVR